MSSQPKWWQGKHGEWYVVLQFVLFALVFFGPRELNGVGLWNAPFRTIGLVFGLLLGALGGVLGLLGLISLGTNLSALPHPKDDAQFVGSGAYRFVRHPIYSGIVIGAFGLACIYGSSLTIIYALFLFIFFDVKSRREERMLVTKFPEYTRYQSETRKLIPFIY